MHLHNGTLFKRLTFLPDGRENLILGEKALLGDRQWSVKPPTNLSYPRFSIIGFWITDQQPEYGII